MNERIKTIKGLISGQVDMGTFGLVELELFALEKELKQTHDNVILPKNVKFPIKANNKVFGNVDIIGIRTECESNNNTMYMVKNNGKYYWIYDYETIII